MSHPCPIKGCATPAKDGQLMCRDHWRRVPKLLNRAVFETYRNLRSDPEPYRDARDEAIRVVNQKVAADLGFDEDHSVEHRPDRRGSIKRSHRAEGRNWVD